MHYLTPLLLAAVSVNAGLINRQNQCTQSYTIIPGFSPPPSSGPICYDTSYYRTADQGRVQADANSSPELQQRCRALCDQDARCQAVIGETHYAADSPLATGVCFFYASTNVTPRSCSDTTRRRLDAAAKTTTCSTTTTTRATTTTTSRTTMTTVTTTTSRSTTTTTTTRSTSTVAPTSTTTTTRSTSTVAPTTTTTTTRSTSTVTPTLTTTTTTRSSSSASTTTTRSSTTTTSSSVALSPTLTSTSTTTIRPSSTSSTSTSSPTTSSSTTTTTTSRSSTTTTSATVPTTTTTSTTRTSTTSTTTQSTTVPTTTTTTTTTTVSTTTSTVSAATVTIDVRALSYMDAMLTAHNVHRSNHSEVLLTWNTALVDSARQLAERCEYGHDTTINGGGYGQNIGAGAAGNAGANIINDLMYNQELPNYPQPYGNNNPDLSNFGAWGHYSQIVWSSTTSVGCYTQYCPNGLSGVGPNVPPYFLVCNYAPAGNVVGGFARVLPPQGGPTVVLIAQ